MAVGINAAAVATALRHPTPELHWIQSEAAEMDDGFADRWPGSIRGTARITKAPDAAAAGTGGIADERAIMSMEAAWNSEIESFNSLSLPVRNRL